MNDLRDFDFYSTYAYTYCARHLEEDGWSKQKWTQATDLYKKKLKAFEIIEKKKVQVGMLIKMFNDEQVIKVAKTYQGNYFLHLYNSCCGELYGRLTQEEYDLLKEMLL